MKRSREPPLTPTREVKREVKKGKKSLIGLAKKMVAISTQSEQEEQDGSKKADAWKWAFHFNKDIYYCTLCPDGTLMDTHFGMKFDRPCHLHLKYVRSLYPNSGMARRSRLNEKWKPSSANSFYHKGKNINAHRERESQNLAKTAPPFTRTVTQEE